MFEERLTTSHPRLLNFYRDHPEIRFEDINLSIVDILERNVLNNSRTSSPLPFYLENILQQQSRQIQDIHHSINNLQLSVVNIEQKSTKIAQEYVDAFKIIVNSNTNDTILPKMEHINHQCLEKIHSIVQDVVPKSCEETQLAIRDIIQASICQFQKSMVEETNDFSQTVSSIDNNQRISQFIDHFEQKIKQMFTSWQQPLFSYISSSEERIHSNLSNLKDLSMRHQTTQEKTAKDVGAFLQKHEGGFQSLGAKPAGEGVGSVSTGGAGGGGGSGSGPLSRTHIHIMLNRMYPTSEVSKVDARALKTTTDPGSSSLSVPPPRLSSQLYSIKRPSSPSILIESKNDETNVDSTDVSQFVELMKHHHMNGILVSQQSGFNQKPNYYIECHDNQLLVFVHNMEYNPEKLRPAIDIIDQLSVKIKQYSTLYCHEATNRTEWIEKEVLDAVNQEYRLFISQKTAIIQQLRESHRKVIAQLEEFQFTSLDQYLSSKYTAPLPKNGHRCDLCNSFNANNLKALAAHKRGCLRKIKPGKENLDSSFVNTFISLDDALGALESPMESI